MLERVDSDRGQVCRMWPRILLYSELPLVASSMVFISRCRSQPQVHVTGGTLKKTTVHELVAEFLEKPWWQCSEEDLPAGLRLID